MTESAMDSVENQPYVDILDDPELLEDIVKYNHSEEEPTDV